MIFTNYENVQHRDDRLKKCARITASIFGLTEEQLDCLIHQFHDHKGQLSVQWVHKPSIRGMQTVRDAWEHLDSPIVTHHWPGCPNGDIEITSRA